MVSRGETERALEAPTRGDFSLTWPHGKQCNLFRGIYLEMVKVLVGSILLQESYLLSATGISLRSNWAGWNRDRLLARLLGLKSTVCTPPAK